MLPLVCLRVRASVIRSIHPKIVTLHRKENVYASFLDWKILLFNVKKRPMHINELVGQPISDVGNMDASGIGAGGT